jgi:hypothetical protein
MKKVSAPKISLIALSLIVIGLGAAELGTRATGIVDFPIYETDGEIGYILAPNQSGTFLNKNDWVINEKSMNAIAWAPQGVRDILVVGDSLVWGGNPLDQADRLGDQLGDLLPDWSVWPIAAGSWSVGNQLEYFHRNPDVLEAADVIVWVFNSGDLNPSSMWAQETTHPRSHPTSAVVYAFDKYVKPRLFKKSAVAVEPTALADPGNEPFNKDIITHLSEFVADQTAAHGTKFLFIAYPGKDLLQNGGGDQKNYDEFLQSLKDAVAGNGVLIDLRELPDWTPDLYRDGIHPNAHGNAVFAAEIARVLQQNQMLESGNADTN